jgi:hypothetical protein
MQLENNITFLFLYAGASGFGGAGTLSIFSVVAEKKKVPTKSIGKEICQFALMLLIKVSLEDTYVARYAFWSSPLNQMHVRTNRKWNGGKKKKKKYQKLFPTISSSNEAALPF